jgi:hypothetical protein
VANIIGAAIAIYCEYIQKGGQHEVNLPATLRLKLEKQFALISQRELSGSSTRGLAVDEPPPTSESRTSWVR